MSKIIARLNFPLFRGRSLEIGRMPRYLRFVTANRGQRTFDVLDQLDDVAEPDEAVFAAVLKTCEPLHIDRTAGGRKIGDWYRLANYELMPEQPDDGTIRDNERWRAWCLERINRKVENAKTNPKEANQGMADA